MPQPFSRSIFLPAWKWTYSRLAAFGVRLNAHWLIWTVYLLVAISVLSLWPAKSLPQVGGSDKLHHALAYAALMFPAALGASRQRLMIAALLIFLYGGVVELVQLKFGRNAEWLDLAANSLGILLGAAVARLFAHIFMKESPLPELPASTD